MKILQNEIALEFPFPKTPGQPLGQPTEFRYLREEQPVVRVQHWDGSRPWLITRYDDCKATLMNPEFFSNNPLFPGYPSGSPALRATIDQERNLRTMDPPEQQTEKAMVQRGLSRRAVDLIRPNMLRYAHELIADFDTDVIDIVDKYSRFIPGMAICELLGVPYTDREFFAAQGAIFLSGDSSEEAAAGAGEALTNYLVDLVRSKAGKDDQDLIATLVNKQVAQGAMTEEEVVGYGRMLLAGGFESTANAIALSVLALLENPVQLEDLVEHVDDRPFLSNAVNELLRYCSPNQTAQRRAVRGDIVVGGQTIRAGDGVIVATASANHDESMFPEPDSLVLRRANADKHLAFGFGPHQCIGQLLARAELEIALSALVKAFPRIELKGDIEEVPTGGRHEITFRLRELPVLLKR